MSVFGIEWFFLAWKTSLWYVMLFGRILPMLEFLATLELILCNPDAALSMMFTNIPNPFLSFQPCSQIFTRGRLHLRHHCLCSSLRRTPQLSTSVSLHQIGHLSRVLFIFLAILTHFNYFFHWRLELFKVTLEGWNHFLQSQAAVSVTSFCESLISDGITSPFHKFSIYFLRHQMNPCLRNLLPSEMYLLNNST